MGVVYDIISDAARAGYELGKGPWAELPDALGGRDPLFAVVALLLEDGSFSPESCRRIARELVDFAAAHPDWRVVNDCQGWDERGVAGMLFSDVAEQHAWFQDTLGLPDDYRPEEDGILCYRRVGAVYQHKGEVNDGAAF